MSHPLEAVFGLAGKVALVTGASSGLGIECATALARAGADVGLVARRRDRLDAVAKDIETEAGVRTCVAVADVTNSDEIRAAIDQIEAALGPIDVLVNNAGIAPISRAFKHAREKWDAAIALNLTAVFEASQAVGARMIERGTPGRIIQMSSALGRGANPVIPTVGYCASKGGVDNLTRQLAIEWAPHGITVNAIAPGYFPTEMTSDPSTGRPEEAMEKTMIERTPMGRLGRAGELAPAVLFLASPMSSYVTGTIVSVDGGWQAW